MGPKVLQGFLEGEEGSLGCVGYGDVDGRRVPKEKIIQM